MFYVGLGEKEVVVVLREANGFGQILSGEGDGSVVVLGLEDCGGREVRL